MVFNRKYNKLLEQYNELQKQNTELIGKLHTLNYKYKTLERLLNIKNNILKIKCKYERQGKPYKQGETYEAKLHPSGSLFNVKVYNGKDLNIYILNKDDLFEEYFEIVTK